MAKKKSMLTVQAKVAGLGRNDDYTEVVLDYRPLRSPLVIWFEAVDEDLDVGDLVTVTIVKSEEKDG